MSASGKRRARRGARKNDGPSKAASPKQLKIAFAVFGVIVRVKRPLAVTVRAVTPPASAKATSAPSTGGSVTPSSV